MSLRVLVALLLLPSASASYAQAPRRVLAVAAASNLRLAGEELARSFEAERPDVDVALTFGASGTFFAQLQSGAPFDVFLSADRAYPLKLVAAGLAAPGDEYVYAYGKLVAWLPAGSRVALARAGLAALRDPAVKRISIANPAVAPFGAATVKALEAAGVYADVKHKLVLGTSVAQAAQFATTGAADVAFLPASLTLSKELAGGQVVPVPESLYPRVEQSAVVVAASKDPGLARAFLAFLAGEKGRAILARNGYGVPATR
jgi:molybdate transport system substrate-binding protein